MESQASSSGTADSQALLWALADFRADVERLIEEHKAAVLSLPAFAAPAEPPPPAPAPTASPYLPPQAAEVAAAEPQPRPTPPRKAGKAGSKPWPRESPAPSPPAAEPPAEALAHEPARPEDARQRLDALAAKLLDRRLKHTAADPAANPRDRSRD